MSRWYAVHTKPRQEQTALVHLERQGYTCYLPLIRERKRVRGQAQWVSAAFFPRYLFAQLDLTRQNTAPIRSTQGVVGLVRFGLEPAALPDGFVDRLRRECGEDGATHVVEWQTGEALEVTDGPFAGLRAVFAARDGEARVIILMDLLGRTQRLTLEEHQLRRAER